MALPPHPATGLATPLLTAAPRRRLLLGLAAGLAAGLATPFLARAHPAEPVTEVTLLTGGAEGGPTDLWLRAFAPFLERHLPHRAVSVSNRPEASRAQLLVTIASAPANGRSLGYAVTPDIFAQPGTGRASGLLKRLRLLGAVAEDPLVLVAPPETSLASLQREREPQTLALPPQGSTAALATPALQEHLPLAPLNFPSAAAARQATLSGNVSAALVRLSDAIAALQESRLAALGLALAERCALLPETPTLGERGIPLVASARRGFVLPAGTPDAVAAPLAAALAKVVADPEYVAQANASGILPGFLDEADWTRLVRQQLAALKL
ncbi:tripartite tricarboxylate transporter substrate-binding protein [Roseomonas gilardii]|uniref:tripartite tricarboxylate transporter substrate-binding protein n=1 Tax=Roseomonas gilardii TaxID=257708 RepID=UPI000A555342|nr:tripartite tricarboxylate transporter substrate-binding protein [Roseomonas gilardii]